MASHPTLKGLTEHGILGIERIAIDGLVKKYELLVKGYSPFRDLPYISYVAGECPYNELKKPVLAEIDADRISPRQAIDKLTKAEEAWERLSQFVVGNLPFVMHYYDSKILENPSTKVNEIFR